MAINKEPIFSGIADIQWIGDMTAAHNVQDLTSGTSYLGFTADATNGGFVTHATLKANPANSTAATVWRAWINNGGVLSTASNSAIIKEIGIPATTTSATAPLPDFIMPLNFALPPGYRIYYTLGTAPGGSGEFTATTFGSKYTAQA